ncbi:MAG TPA: hypothetical protein VHG52_03845, partial [Thermomicrobiales bacterium]|nr:hypothetical protein [Thermomicrobiales bacterium]
MSTSHESRTHTLADTIRRTMRVLGAQPSPVNDGAAKRAAARLVYERVRRAGVSARWFEGDG